MSIHATDVIMGDIRLLCEGNFTDTTYKKIQEGRNIYKLMESKNLDRAIGANANFCIMPESVLHKAVEGKSVDTLHTFLVDGKTALCKYRLAILVLRKKEAPLRFYITGFMHWDSQDGGCVWNMEGCTADEMCNELTRIGVNLEGLEFF